MIGPTSDWRLKPGFFRVVKYQRTTVIVATFIVSSIVVATIILTFSIVVATIADMGRNKLPDDERREKPLRIRLSKDERAEIDKAADGKASTWARDVLLKAARRKTR